MQTQCSVKGCQVGARHACNKCQAKLCGQNYCSMFHSGICGRIPSSTVSSSSSSSSSSIMQPVPDQVHSAIDAFALRKQDKQLLKVASLAREQGDGALATMCINKHLALNAKIGAAMASGYEESAAVPASEVWSDILERLAFQSDNKAVTSALTKVKYAIGQDAALEQNDAAMALASDMALMAMEGRDEAIEAFAEEYPVGAEMIAGFLSGGAKREEKKYAKTVRDLSVDELLEQAEGYTAKLTPGTESSKGLSAKAKAVLKRFRGSKGKAKGRLRAITAELRRRALDLEGEKLERVKSALSDASRVIA